MAQLDDNGNNALLPIQQSLTALGYAPSVFAALKAMIENSDLATSALNAYGARTWPNGDHWQINVEQTGDFTFSTDAGSSLGQIYVDQSQLGSLSKGAGFVETFVSKLGHELGNSATVIADPALAAVMS